jgi:hypothetical protein
LDQNVLLRSLSHARVRFYELHNMVNGIESNPLRWPWKRWAVDATAAFQVSLPRLPAYSQYHSTMSLLRCTDLYSLSPPSEDSPAPCSP